MKSSAFVFGSIWAAAVCVFLWLDGPARAQDATPDADDAVPSGSTGASDAPVGTQAADAAEVEEGGDADFVYESVTVAERVPEDPFLSRRSVSVRDAEDLAEQAPRTVPEALWDAPGVFVQQTNHGGGSPILRGMIGPQNLILVDGVRLNNSVYRTGPLQYLNLLDPLSVDRIEVLRGPGSVLYGSDAMGGVIEVAPLSPVGCCDDSGATASGRGLLRFGSASLQRTAHVDATAGASGFGALGGATFTALDDLSGGRETGVQPYSGYDDLSAIGGLSYEIRDGELLGSTFRLTYLMTRIWDAGRTDKLYDRNSLQMYDNFDDLLYGRAHLRIRPIATDADMRVSYQHFFERKDGTTVEDDYQTEVSTTRDEVTVHTLGADLQLDTRLFDRSLRLRYGGMWYHDWVGAERFRRDAGQAFEPSTPASYPDDSTYDNFGAFAVVEGDPVATEGGHVLRLSAGYRFHGMAGYAPATDVVDEADFSDTGNVFLASAQYLYNDVVNVAATFSQGFRAPNLQEAVQMGDTGKYYHIPNDELGPERSDTVELVSRGRFAPVTIGVSGYVSLLHDLIRREETTWEGQDEVDGKPVAWNVNGGEGLLWGVEGTIDVALGAGVSMSGAITYTWGEEDVPDGPDVPLTRIPPLFGRIGLRYDTPAGGNVTGFVETFVRAAADQTRLSPEDERDARIPEGGTPGWWTWNLRGGVDLYDSWRIGAVVENLLNEDYKYHGSGVYAPGTNAVLTVEGRF